MARSRRAEAYHHPVNQRLIDDAPVGDRVADRVTAFIGSWKFIFIQTVVVSIWIAGNVYLYFNFDHYPFILLNLAFSLEAAYTAPLILLAGNRSAARDRMTLEHTATETDKEDRQNQELLRRTSDLIQRIEGLEERILSNQATLARAVGLPLPPQAVSDEGNP
jgi:uncharacterized membrane protein